LISSLTERCASQGIRFDTGFDGTNPMWARGRIGRRFFAFLYRGDTASLTIGSPKHRDMAGRARHARRKALRALRRSDDAESPSLFFRRRDLKRDALLDRRPSRVIWHATRDNVTGHWGGTLEPEEAAELFLEMLSQVQRPEQGPKRSEFDSAIRRGSYTPPSGWKQGIIRKPSRKRR
jgi:hypothetical protein